MQDQDKIIKEEHCSSHTRFPMKSWKLKQVIPSLGADTQSRETKQSHSRQTCTQLTILWVALRSSQEVNSSLAGAMECTGLPHEGETRSLAETLSSVGLSLITDVIKLQKITLRHKKYTNARFEYSHTSWMALIGKSENVCMHLPSL